MLDVRRVLATTARSQSAPRRDEPCWWSERAIGQSSMTSDDAAPEGRRGRSRTWASSRPGLRIGTTRRRPLRCVCARRFTADSCRSLVAEASAGPTEGRRSSPRRLGRSVPPKAVHLCPGRASTITRSGGGSRPPRREVLSNLLPSSTDARSPYVRRGLSVALAPLGEAIPV